MLNVVMFIIQPTFQPGDSQPVAVKGQHGLLNVEAWARQCRQFFARSLRGQRYKMDCQVDLEINFLSWSQTNSIVTYETFSELSQRDMFHVLVCLPNAIIYVRSFNIQLGYESCLRNILQCSNNFYTQSVSIVSTHYSYPCSATIPW